jgi:hypothetical protein
VRPDLGEQHLLDATRIQLSFGFLGQAPAVGLAVVCDRDRLVAPAVRQIVPGDRALLIVAADYPEHVVEPALGQHRIGRGIRDHEGAGRGMHFRRRESRS